MRLNLREKTFLAVGLALILALGFYFLVVEPLAEAAERRRGLVARLEEELTEVRAVAAQYQALSARQRRFQAQVEARGQDFSPFSHLENLARQAGLEGRIESMTPVASSGEEGGPGYAEFDIRLREIKLLTLVRFLYRLEASEQVFVVVNLTIRPRYLSPDQLDVSLRVATPAPAS